jgi:hypothetical protein
MRVISSEAVANKKQIPRRLKPPRDDKNKGLVTAQLKAVALQNTAEIEFFSSL